MRNQLQCVLLIDDSEADNYLHQLVIEEAGCARNVRVCCSGLEALNYFGDMITKNLPKPELIFLDINMPLMNGWEFLEAYGRLPEENKSGIIVTMLTASMHNMDREKAKNVQVVRDFIAKPLTVEKLNDLLSQFFPQRF